MKKTIERKIIDRKAKLPNRFIWWALSQLVVPILAKKYKPTYNIKDNIRKTKGAKFVIFNHQSRMDYLWAIQMAHGERLTFVIGNNEFYRKKFSFIFNLLHFIPKKNFTSDFNGVKKINGIIKKGGTICFSPEGMSSIYGCQQPIVPGTGRFFKHYKIPVFISKSNGSYLTAHKVCLDERPGRIEAEFYCLFTPEQLEKLTEKEIEDKINEALWTDDYEWNKEKHYKFKINGKAANRYEDIIYRCPKCGEELHMVSDGNVLKCEHCGNGIVFDEYYDLHPLNEGDVVFESPSKYMAIQRKIEYNRIKSDPIYSLTCNVKLKELPKYKYIKNNDTAIECGEGVVIVNKDGLSFKGTRHGEPFEFLLNYKQLWTLVIVTDCTFTGLYLNGEYLEIHPDKPVIGKMLLMVEEFSRLQYNVWPNYPWMDWIYKD